MTRCHSLRHSHTNAEARGSATTDSTQAIQRAGSGAASRPSTSSQIAVTDTMLRRTLSTIFQRDSSGRAGSPAGSLATTLRRRIIHRRFCQSPRIQRCRRRASAA